MSNRAEESSATVVTTTVRYAKDLFDLSFLLAGNGGSAKAELQFSDGTEETFSWFHDEISYDVSDFIGKTMTEIRQMHYERDLAYLRS